MNKISDAIKGIVQGNAFLEFGVCHQLFNLTQLARYLQPFVAARTKKEVSVSAITMAMSRMGPQFVANTPKPSDFQLEKVHITTGLCTATFQRSIEAHRAINKLHIDMQKKNAFCSVSEGMTEITVIVECRFEQKLLSWSKVKPVFSHSRLASVEILFGSSYTDTPGMLYMLLQRVALQNINLIEVSSTYSGIILFVAEQDTTLVFDTLYQSMMMP